MAIGLDKEVEKAQKAADEVIRGNEGVEEETMKELMWVYTIILNHSQLRLFSFELR